MNNFFNDNDDNDDFRDHPDEMNGNQSFIPNVKQPPAPPPQRTAKAPVIPPPVVEEYEEVVEASEPEEEDYTAYLNDARIRLEQGRLYEMLINHDIFAGLDSDPKAIKVVQSQIRRFAKNQMEIMLGMRQEVQKTQSISIDNFPFNDLEVITLKTIAATFSKGATEDPRAQQYSGSPPPVRKTGLNSLGSKPQQKQQPSIQKPQAKPLASKPADPIKRVKVDKSVELALQQEGVERFYIEEAKKQLESEQYKPIDKPLSELGEDELAKRNREASLRNRQAAVNPSASPMPNVDQQIMFHTSRAMDGSNLGVGTQQLMRMLKQ